MRLSCALHFSHSCTEKNKMTEKTTEKIDEKQIDAELEQSNEKTTRTPTEAERKLVQLAVKQYEGYQSDYSDEITKAKDDIAFCVDGDHWTIGDKDVKAEREADGRLAFTKNRAPGFIDNVTGDVRQNMPRIKFRPVDSKTDPKLADIYNAGIKYVESISRAHRQYIPAFEQACTGGYPGWCQLLTDYVDDESFEQDISVRFIPSQFGPALDPTATILDEPRKGGPKWGIIPKGMSWVEYNERFPNASLKSWDQAKNEKAKWCNDKTVTVASYYRAVPTQDVLYRFEGVAKMMRGKSDEYKTFIEQNPDAKPTRERKVITWEIKHYLINGVEVLEGPESWAGKFIPLIPFEGKWFMDNGKKKYRSVYHEAKDANRQEDLWASTITELLIDEPYMATPKQIGAHKTMWEARNKKKFGVLYYEPDDRLPQGNRPVKEDNSQKLQGAFNMVRQTIDDEKALANVYNASLGQTGNETSGRAINARDAQSNTTNFAFVDNGMVAPLEYLAMQFVDLFPKIYDYEMTLKITGEDDREAGEVTINKTEPVEGKDGIETGVMHEVKDKQGNVVQQLFKDLADVRFNITVDVGPGMKTQRMEATDTLVKLAQGNPMMSEIGGDLLAKSIDGFQYDEEIARRYEIALNLKYPGMIEKEGEDPQAGIQAAVQQAVEQFKQQMMPQMQQLEANIQSTNQALQVKEAEKQKLLQENQKLQAEKDAATQLMKDKERELTLELREFRLEQREKELQAQTGKTEGEEGVKSELTDLQKQVAQLAESFEKFMNQKQEAA